MIDNLTALDLLYPDPFDYVREMDNKRYQKYLWYRLKDILPDLKEEGIQLNMWSFRKFMSFETRAWRKGVDITGFSYFVTDNGMSGISSFSEDRKKYLYIEFDLKHYLYATIDSDLLKTDGFFKLLREVKSFQNK